MALNSKIILCKNIKIDRNYKNCLTYTETQMLALCNANAVKVGNDYTFIGGKGSRTIEVPYTYGDCLQCNYLAYQNTLYSNKWYFAFIDNVEYRSDSSTRITFTVDYFHTWYDYYDKKSCFVVREHVSDDTIGLHTIPENLETGEYIATGNDYIFTNANSCYIAVACTTLPSPISSDYTGYQYGGIFSGSMIILFDSPTEVTKFIKFMDEDAKADAIVSIFMVPTIFKGNATFTTYTFSSPVETRSIKCAIPDSTTSATILEQDKAITIPTALNGYVPKNNKVFCYPYNYFYLTNKSGADVEYHYEDFINNSPTFTTIGVMSAGCSIRAVPKNHKKLADTGSSLLSYNYGISIAKYPICSWQSDVYTNWLTANGINVAVQYATSALSIGAGIAMLATGAGAMAGAGFIAGGVMGIAGEMKQEYEHSLTPPQAKGNTNAGDVQFANKSMGILAYKMCIRNEYARSIDNFFTMFGYKVNILEVPNLNSRSVFNYIQIGQGEILAYQKNNVLSVPPQDLEEINNIYRKGVTLWHDHANIGNYNLNNTIVP